MLQSKAFCPVLAGSVIIGESDSTEKRRNSLLYMVGATGFEPATTGPPDRCATGLRHAPKISCGGTVNNLSTFVRFDKSLDQLSH
jgi:hypothetical protein